MDPLLKILSDDEKQIDILTARYKHLKENIDNETKADKEARIHLAEQIAAMKKLNAAIVDHYLGEHKLETAEIEKIVKTHTEN